MNNDWILEKTRNFAGARIKIFTQQQDQPWCEGIRGAAGAPYSERTGRDLYEDMEAEFVWKTSNRWGFEPDCLAREP